MFFIAGLIKVLQIRRQGLDISEILFTVTLNRNSTIASDNNNFVKIILAACASHYRTPFTPYYHFKLPSLKGRGIPAMRSYI